LSLNLPAGAKSAVLFFLLLFLSLSRSGEAKTISPPSSPRLPSPRENGARAVVLVIAGVTWRELRSPELPNISRLLQTASVGLMNTRGPKDRDYAGLWFTLGCGRNAAAGMPDISISPTSQGAFQVKQIAELQEANRRLHTQATPGLLGELLKTKLPALLKFSTAPDYSPAIVMEENGKFGYQEISPEKLLGDNSELLASALAKSSFLVISLPLPEAALIGDYPQIPGLSPERKRLLAAADKLLGEIVAQTGPEDFVALLSPSCPDFANPHVRSLAPIILRGRQFPAGLLESPGTRRVGVVTNVDFAPTLLSYFQVPLPLEMSGRTLKTVPATDALTKLDEIDRQAAVTYRLREEVTPGYLGMVGVLLLLFLSLLLLRPAWLARLGGFPLLAVLGIAALPLATILLSLFVIASATSYFLLSLLLALLLALAAKRRQAFPADFAMICLLTASVIWLDLLTGSRLMSRSIIGYDPIIGERFYGLGNIEAGVFISALIIFLGVLLSAASRRKAGNVGFPAALLIGLAVFCVGAASAGANWGQGISAAITAGSFYLLLAPPGKRARRLLPALLLVLAAAALFVAVDFLLPRAQQSHLAYSVRLTSHHGVPAFLDIAGRKLAMARRVFSYSPLLPLGLLFLLLTILLPLRPPRKIAGIMRRLPAFSAALAACGIGAVAASILNDSGIAAGMSLVTLPTLALVGAALEESRANSCR
jgi:hypothetical protein